MSATVMFLPGDTLGWRWLRIDDGDVVARGEGVPVLDASPVTAVAPAGDVTLHWAALPDRSTAQSVAAARILVAEASASPLAELHVAVGREEAAEERPIGVVAATEVARWLAMLAEAGVDPVAIVPAPMLLPRPDEGYVRADLAGEGVVRGGTSGFADEARLTELVTGGVVPETLARGESDAAIVAAVAAPALDLRQGVFARRRRRAIDWRLVRRLAVLGLALLSVTLAIDLVRIGKYSFGADTVEARADELARRGLPRGETVNDAGRQLEARVAGVRGPGLGFSRTAAAAYAAVRSVPGSEVTAMTFEPNGSLRLGVATQGEGQANDLKRAMEAAGFATTASVFASAGGRVTGELTVSPR